MSFTKKIFFWLWCMYSFSIFAHPVIYKNGIVLNSFSTPSFGDHYVTYSWERNWAGGLNYYRFSKDDQNSELIFAKINHLLYRYNGLASQGNIYFHTGAGLLDSEIGVKKTEDAYMAGIEMDWETRILYTSFKHLHFTSPQLVDSSMSMARVGFSPYEADFDKLQSWIMLQAMYAPDVEKTLSITPMLRFFHHNVLWELGSSFRGEWMLNLMVHY